MQSITLGLPIAPIPEAGRVKIKKLISFLIKKYKGPLDFFFSNDLGGSGVLGPGR